jgi:GWxTD domain-containing protein
LAAALGSAPVPQPGKLRPKDLPPRYREWLEQEVVYIISAKEKDVFLQLASDRERDLFIQAFWRQRDPTPGTPINEFKEEHAQRIAYANEYFSRGATRSGWMTDRGKVYIILGPPLDISRSEGESYCYPAQVWSYQGRPEYGLPSHFEIVFFKRRGNGEFVLYSPSEDGPASLLVNYRGDPTNASAAYAQLRKFDARLAEASLSLIPGEIPSLGQSALASDLLLARILAVPEKSVDAKYAEALLKYKDVIEVDYSANYIGSDSLASVIRDRSGLFFLHYAIRPDKLSLAPRDGAYGLNVELNGILKDPEGRVIFQYDKTFLLSFAPAEIEEVGKTGVLFEDAVPVAPGEYNFSVLMKNTGSREFTSFEKRLVVPKSFPEGCAISPLLLGYKAKGLPAEPRQVKPFRAGDTQLYCRPGWTFGSGETLTVFFQIYAMSADLRRSGRLEYVFERQGQEALRREVPLAELPLLDIVREFPLKDLPPESYRLRVTVRDAQGRAVAATESNFDVSPVAAIPEPLVAAKVMPPADHPMYAYLVGDQLMKAGDAERAGGLLASAYRANPQMLDYAQAYAEWLAHGQDYDRALDVLRPFSEAAPGKPEVLVLLGTWSRTVKQYRQAVDFFQRFLDRAGMRPDILNDLAECHLALGDPSAARAAWEKSLAIDPRQEKVRTSLERLKK